MESKDQSPDPKVVFPTFPNHRPPLKGGDGGGTSGGMTDDWKQSVDRQLGQLHGDVRHLLFGFAAGFLILLSAGISGYLLLDSKFSSKFEGIDSKFDTIDARLTAVERKVDVIDTKLDILIDRSSANPRPASQP